MATWKLSPQYKKSAVEKMFFYKDGKCITVETGYRWGIFNVESDEQPLTNLELKNEDGYELGCIENDESWELWELTDGCWVDIESARDNTTSTDVEEFIVAWEEDSYDGVESLGWSNDDTEYYYHGPLELTNEDTGEVFYGEPPVAHEQTEAQLKAELDELIASMPTGLHVTNTDNPIDFPSTEDEVTDWFPVDINPVHKGMYEVIVSDAPAAWPFPYSVSNATWNGTAWNTNVEKWRGLAKEPK